MKRILILTACVVLGTALAANAFDQDVFRATLVPLSSTQNEIDLTLLSTGWPVDGLGAPKLCDGFDVTCVTVASEPLATLHLAGTHNPDDSGNWSTYLTNAIQPTTPPSTYFNFDTTLDDVVNSGTFPNVTGFQFTGFASYPSGYLSPTGNNFLGSIIINNGMWVHMTGSLIFSDTTTHTFDVVVPEPGTLAMLICGGLTLIGMGLARWRRR